MFRQFLMRHDDIKITSRKVLVLAAYAAYAVHVIHGGHRARWTGGVAALFGLLMLISPFIMSGNIASGDPFLDNVLVGAIIVVLSAYTAVALRGE